MTAFYQRLFAGDRVADAVSAGRERLHLRCDRPSPKGPMPLDDWMVPVHYARRDVYFPNLRTNGTSSGEPSVPRKRTDPLAPRDTFVGRDELFYQLEVAAQLQPVVLLHGPGGTGKTELAKAFARWWRDTGALDDPNLVIWHSFEPGVPSFGMEGLLSTIGLQVFGTDFELLEADERQAIIWQLLAERRALLVWDNFESVYSMPDPTSATPPLDEVGYRKLGLFLTFVVLSARCTVLIVSRSPELGFGDSGRVSVSGLAPEEANEYADQLLAAYPNARARREDRAFGELMEWLAGHPLSMRLTLHHLDTTEPRALLDGLRGLTPLPGGNDERTTSLPASITYSIRHLRPNTRRLLVAVSLFHSVVHRAVISILAEQPLAPSRFSGTSTADWKQVLEEAAAVGLLTPLGGPMYAIHPALPAYLVDQWRADDPDAYAEQREAATLALLDAYAYFARWAEQEITGGDAAVAYSMIDLQRRTLGDLLGYALNNGYWAKAQSIAKPLNRFWNARGLYQEACGWVDRVRHALESASGAPPELSDPAGSLWIFFVTAQASRQLTAGLHDSAERTYRAIHDMIAALPESDPQRHYLAFTYRRLGQIAQERGRLDEAEAWQRKSLAITEELNELADAALNYHHLGIVTHQRGRLDEAEAWYRKSLTIKRKRNDRPGAAASYHQLGAIAQERGRLREAEAWHHKSLAITEAIGEQAGSARNQAQLGRLALLQGREGEAEAWLRKSVANYEKLGLRKEEPGCYKLLSAISIVQGRLGEAEDWLRRALTIDTQLGNQIGQAESFGQLGILMEARGRSEEALEWLVRSFVQFEEFSHLTTNVDHHLTRLTAVQGVDALQRCWLKVTGQPVPAEVLAYVEANKPKESG